MTKRVVLAYSGGLDTSVAVRWIREEWGYEVGRAARSTSASSSRARTSSSAIARVAAGAVEVEVIDARAEFA